MRRCQAASLEEAREEGQEDPASRGPRASVCATNETIKINRRPRRAEMSRNLQLTTRTSSTLKKMIYQNPIEIVRFLVETAFPCMVPQNQKPISLKGRVLNIYHMTIYHGT